MPDEELYAYINLPDGYDPALVSGTVVVAAKTFLGDHEVVWKAEVGTGGRSDVEIKGAAAAQLAEAGFSVVWWRRQDNPLHGWRARAQRAHGDD